MLDDAELMHNREAIAKLSRLRGGFFLERTAILGIVPDNRQKWGMGGISHAGRIHVRVQPKRSREFILLGSQVPEEVRDRMVRTLGIGVTSVV